MFKITDDNYQEYKKIFEIIWLVRDNGLRARLNLPPEDSPIVIMSNCEKKSMSLAKRGLKESLRDSLSMLSAIGIPPALINEINVQLAAHNLPTLNKLVATIKDTPAKVLKRGRIKYMDEYYIIKEVICDVDYDISNADRIELEKLFTGFEFKKGNSKKAK